MSEWSRCSSKLLAKLISQFCMENLLQPVDNRLDLGGVSYTFEATRGAFGSWQVAADSTGPLWPAMSRS